MKIILIFLLSITISSCCSINYEKMPVEKLMEEYSKFVSNITSQESSSIITLQTSGCLGRCPVFALGIYENGRTEIFGRAYLTKIGPFEIMLEKPKVDTLIQILENNNYVNLKDEYLSIIDTLEDGRIQISSISDATVQTLSFKLKGNNRKIIKKQIGEPKWLNQFTNKIYSYINIKKYLPKYK